MENVIGGREESKELGWRLALPESIVNIVRYWMANYTDFTLEDPKEEDFFLSLVGGLLENPMRLELSASESLAMRRSTQVKYQAILQFVGTPYHRIPLAYFASSFQFPLFNLLSSLSEPEKRCFQQRSAPGLDGEIHLSAFYFDPLLNEYYDPYLYIIVAYYLNMINLTNPVITGCREKEDWLPRHFHSLRALNEEALERITCFPNRKDKTLKLREDLRLLRKALELDDIYKAIENCQHLFHERASLSFTVVI